MGSTRAHYLPSQLHKTQESNFPARCSSCENESRLVRNRRTRRQLTRRPPGKSSKLVSDWSSQECAQCPSPVRAAADAAAAPRLKLQDKATRERAAHRNRSETRHRDKERAP